MLTGPANVPADWNGHDKPALTRTDVAWLRAEYHGGKTARGLADHYGVSIRTIYRALRPGYLRPKCPTCGR